MLILKNIYIIFIRMSVYGHITPLLDKQDTSELLLFTKL